MNGIVKKIKNALKIAAATLVITSTIAAGAAAYAGYKYSDYAEGDQIVEIAEELNCDTSYLTKSDNHFVAMEHNGDEPIYVYFDESVSDKDKAIAIESLEYVFGIVGEINENYRYKIVDENVYNLKQGKTTIKYSTGDPQSYYKGEGFDVEGLATSKPNLLTKLTNKRLCNQFYIKVSDHDGGEVQHDKRMYTYVHELMHLFGFDDVHTLKYLATTTKYYGNTMMQSGHGNGKMSYILTPNDYKILLSLYTSNLDEKQLADRIEDYKEKIADYERKYYEMFSKEVFLSSGATQQLENGDLNFTGSACLTDFDGSVYENFYEISIIDNKYTFKIFDKNYTLVDEASGDVYRNNGVAVLKQVELTKGIHPANIYETYEGGYIEDWAVIEKDDHVELYNIFTNAGYWLQYTDLENSLQQ